MQRPRRGVIGVASPTEPQAQQRSLRRAGVALTAIAALLLLAATPVLWREYGAALGSAGLAALAVAAAAVLVLLALLVRALRDGRRRLGAALQELRTTAANLGEAQQVARMGYWERDLERDRLTLSPGLCALFDDALAPGEHNADALALLVHPDDRERVRQAADAAVASGGNFDVEHRVRLPGGNERVVRTRGALVVGNDGRRRIVGTTQDISGPAAVRERLRRAQEQYRLLFERNPLPMWIYDMHSLRFLAVNTAATAEYGYSEEEFLARTILDIRPPEDVAEVTVVLATWDNSERQGRVWRHLHKDGAVAYVSVSATDIDFDGRRARLVLVQDVSARLRAEEERGRSELRFSIIARASSDAIYDLDISTGRLWWSDGFADIFGYAPAQVPETLGQWEALVHRDDRAAVAASLQRALDGDALGWEFSYRFRRADGSYAEVEDRGHFLRDAHGAAVRMIGAMLDVSARRADEAQLRRAQAELAHRATHDLLTGLPNRALVTERLAAAIRAADAGAPVPVVVFVGLDHFKLINDTLGHAVGDHVLRAVAERLAGVDGELLLLGRFGGDEFVLLFEERGGDAASEARIAAVVAELTRPLEVLDTLHYLTPSIGWGAYPEAGTDAGTLLRNVDLAMYQAKQSGRNHVVRYAAGFSVAVAERLRLVSRLRRALANDEFELHFQPKYRCADLAPLGLEALLRWHDPDRGLVAPGEFIGVAEDSGLIVPIGRWVLREAARHHAQLVDAGFGSLSIAVNVSSPQFQRGELLADLRALVAEFALPDGALEVELTESVILDSPEATIAEMGQLRALGVSVAIDDFGTGYSSLGYLRRLPADTLKIDRSFIADLGVDGDSSAICAAIIALAHDLGRSVVAEGVETAEQLEWLRARGCDGVQGFLLARPQPFAQALLALSRPG